MCVENLAEMFVLRPPVHRHRATVLCTAAFPEVCGHREAACIARARLVTFLLQCNAPLTMPLQIRLCRSLVCFCEGQGVGYTSASRGGGHWAGFRDILEWLTTIVGAPPDPHPPDQSDHHGKKRNLHE